MRKKGAYSSLFYLRYEHEARATTVGATDSHCADKSAPTPHERPMHKENLLKQLLISLGLGLLLLVFALLTSGIFFTGVVVKNTPDVSKNVAHK